LSLTQIAAFPLNFDADCPTVSSALILLLVYSLSWSPGNGTKMFSSSNYLITYFYIQYMRAPIANPLTIAIPTEIPT
jgi:hypothetical protein